MEHDIVEAGEALRAHACALPGAYEEYPWGERVVKVAKKVFVFMGKVDDERPVFGLSVKLPDSGDEALALPYAKPTGYGLGKSGWVSVQFEAGETIPLETLRRWIDESYRAVAPKKLVAQLDAGPATASPAPTKTKPKAKAKPKARAAVKKPAARAKRTAATGTAAKPRAKKRARG